MPCSTYRSISPGSAPLASGRRARRRHPRSTVWRSSALPPASTPKSRTPGPSRLGTVAALAAGERALALERRSVFAAPSVQVGFETGDPTGAEPGVLPTIGISLPLPLLSQNRGAVALAAARRDRARAELEVARRES